MKNRTRKKPPATRPLVGYNTALKLTLDHIDALGTITCPLIECEGCIAAEAVLSKADSPSVDASMKDGYAVRSSNLAAANPTNPVRLHLSGTVGAGPPLRRPVHSGQSIRILTGACLPSGADAVVAEEYVQKEGTSLEIQSPLEPGRNILRKGSDLAFGERIVEPGHRLTPGLIGLLAAGGHDRIRVFRRPRIGLIATGNEVLLPGDPMEDGKLYASNVMTLAAWCRKYNCSVSMMHAPDDRKILQNVIMQAIGACDAVITSGGAWTGDRDLMSKTLDDLGWRKIYHRVRLGPGKAVGFGRLEGKTVFILPGGPPSNLVAFLKLALPGILKMAGEQPPMLPIRIAKMVTSLEGQVDWTQAVFGHLQPSPEGMQFQPVNGRSRLRNMAEASGLMLIPEGRREIAEGETISVQLLT